jgi:hypothetical protein
MSVFATHTDKKQAIHEHEQQRRQQHRRQHQQPDQDQRKRQRKLDVQQQQRVISGKKKKNRPMPPYTKDVLKRYNQRVFTDNVRLTAEVKELKQALAATETKLVAEEQDSFDTRFEREEAINFSCYLLQCMYHDGFTGALKMFEEYGSERYDGRCTAPLITNDAEFEGVVAGGYTQWMESLTYSQPPSATQEDAEVCEKLD